MQEKDLLQTNLNLYLNANYIEGNIPMRDLLLNHQIQRET